MPTFGIISEGPSDQIVIENILSGYFGDPNLEVRHLQPLRDATDASDIRKFGGWFKVFEYCQSQNIVDALEHNEYLIIQVDTDCCEEKHYDISRRHDSGRDRSPEEMIEKVLEKFQQLLEKHHGQQVDKFKNRLIFAICVEELECWLLPLYHKDKKRSATRNCINKLNPRLGEEFGVYIDKSNKSPVLRYYEKFSKPFLKRKNIDAICDDNVSLKIFLNKLQEIKLLKT